MRTTGSIRFIAAATTVVFLVISSSFSAAAGTINIDFESIVGGGGAISIPGVYVEDGYDVSVNTGDVVLHEFVYPGEGVAFPNFGFDDQLMTIARSDGGTFDLVSLTFGEMNSTAPVFAFDVNGLKADSTVVSLSVLLNGTKGLETFAFSGFASLLSVSFGSNGFGVNTAPENLVLANAVVTTVPIPAALPLLLTGLAGLWLIGMRRPSRRQYRVVCRVLCTVLAATVITGVGAVNSDAAPIRQIDFSATQIVSHSANFFDLLGIGQVSAASGSFRFDAGAAPLSGPINVSSGDTFGIIENKAYLSFSINIGGVVLEGAPSDPDNLISVTDGVGSATNDGLTVTSQDDIVLSPGVTLSGMFVQSFGGGPNLFAGTNVPNVGTLNSLPGDRLQINLTFQNQQGSGGSFFALGNIEYSETAVVPLPASLPLLLASLVGLVLMGRKKNRKSSLAITVALACAAAAFVSSHSASAATITHLFAGTISVNEPAIVGISGPDAISVGDPFSATLTYDTAQAPVSAGPSFARYADYSLTFSVDGLFFEQDPAFDLTIWDNNFSGFDEVWVQGSNGYARLTLTDGDKSVFSDVSLPAALNLADFEERSVRVYYDNPSGGSSLELRGTITSVQTTVVPPPAALPLLLTGLAGLGLFGCRRRETA